MEPSETLDFKPKDLRARIQARAKLTQIQPEITPIYGKRARAQASTSETIDIFGSTRTPFAGKSFFGGNDNLTDISDNSSPLQKEFPFQNDPLIERSQNNLMNPELKTIDTTQIKSTLPTNLVSRKLFGGVSLSLMTALIGSIVFQVILMQKVSQLESRSTKLENIVLPGTWSNGTETYDHKPLEDGLTSNTDKISTLETSVIPGIQDSLSDNIDKTNNLEDVIIPGIEADLASNVAKTDNLETVTIPSVQSDLSANVAKTNNLETVVIPDIQNDLSANVAKTNNLETTVIPSIQNDLSANFAKTINLETVVIPDIQDDLSANIAKTDNLETVTIPAIQSDLTANIAKTTNIEAVMIPAIQTSLTANIAKTTNFETVTIPAIQTSLTANIAKTTTLENMIKALPKLYFGKTSTSAWQAYGSAGIVQTVDISSYSLVNPPIVITSIGGTNAHWSTTGGSSVYSISKDSFTVYLRYSDGSPLTPANAVTYNWQLQYVIFSTDS